MISARKNNRDIYPRRFVAIFLSLLLVFMLRSSRVLEKTSCNAPPCFPKAEQETLAEYNSAPSNIHKTQEVQDAQPAEHDTSSTASTPSSPPVSNENEEDEVNGGEEDVSQLTCQHCNSIEHSTEQCLILSVKRGASGRWSVPEVGIDVAVFCSNEQSVVDAIDSAAFFEYGNNYLLGDHWNQGFEAIKNCQPGMAASFDTLEGNNKYLCVDVITGHNTGKSITDDSGVDLRDYPLQDAIICYTCNDSWKNITIVIFQQDI